MTRAERTEHAHDFLVEEGVQPTIDDDDGDIYFRVEGRPYFILSTDDATYFRLAGVGFWSIENERERAQVHQAATYATMSTKVAKVFPNRDNTWATLERFASPMSAVLPVFLRSITALQVAVQRFKSKMHELAAPE